MAATTQKLCLVSMFYFISAFNIDIEHAIIYTGNFNGGNFGVETAMFEANGIKWITIGAPLENSTSQPDITRPGNVYICQIVLSSAEGTECVIMKGLVSNENTAAAPPPGIYEQNSQLLGATILTMQRSILICAPQWKNIKSFDFLSQAYSLYGTCYQVSLKDASDVRKRIVRISALERPIYDNAEMGFSAASTKHPAFNVVLGAPNADPASRGAIAIYIEFSEDASFLVKYSVTETATLNTTFSSGAYFGYAVASGSFGNSNPMESIEIVVGAPGFANEKGVVGSISIISLSVVDGISSSMSQIKQFSGDQMGSGYGQSVCVADMNNDGFDDVLVGAPLVYILDSKTSRLAIETGAVYLYYGTNNADVLSGNKQILQGSNKPSSRFGTSIANLGDISNDGINDIAIGAPYEEDGRGAIYIFNGHRNFRNNGMYSQRIPAEELNENLRGFGFQISQPTLDVDDNLYHDFSVGSYLSDNAVLLRSRPIVDLSARIIFSPTLIPLNSSGLLCDYLHDDNPCLILKMCFNFTGKGLNSIDVQFTLHADTSRTSNRKSSRLQFINDGEDNGDEFTIDIISVQANKESCYELIARVQNLNREFYQALEEKVKFNATYSLSNITTGMNVQPILSKDSVLFVENEIAFHTGCSEDRCLSNLGVQLSLSKSTIVYGIQNEPETIKVSVEVTNTGEPSYSTIVEIYYSNNTDYLENSFILGRTSNKLSCMSASDENNKTFVRCPFDEPLYATQSGSFILRFDVSRSTVLPSMLSFSDFQKTIDFSVTAKTEKDVYQLDNSQMKRVEIGFQADLTITGYSEEQIELSTSKQFITFSNTYSLYNDETLPVEGAIILLEIPVKYEVLTMLTFKIITGNPNDKCIVTEEISGDQSIYQTMELENPEDIIQDPSIQTISCNSESKYTCSRVMCTLGLIQINERRTFTITFNMTESNTPTLEEGKKFLKYITSAQVFPLEDTIIPLTFSSNSSTMVDIDFIFPESFVQETQEIDIWIIIGGCIGGLLLFIILGIALWKCGFFERKKKKAVDDYKRKSMMYKRQSRMASMKSPQEDQAILNEVKEIPE